MVERKKPGQKKARKKFAWYIMNDTHNNLIILSYYRVRIVVHSQCCLLSPTLAVVLYCTLSRNRLFLNLLEDYNLRKVKYGNHDEERERE